MLLLGRVRILLLLLQVIQVISPVRAFRAVEGAFARPERDRRGHDVSRKGLPQCAARSPYQAVKAKFATGDRNPIDQDGLSPRCLRVRGSTPPLGKVS